MSFLNQNLKKFIHSRREFYLSITPHSLEWVGEPPNNFNALRSAGAGVHILCAH